MKRTVLLAAAGLLVTGGAQAYETRCVKRHSHQCYETIQAAVDASSKGDVIWVYPTHDSRGYRENVTVPVEDLTIQGVYVDGGPIVYGEEVDPAALPALGVHAENDKQKEKEKAPSGCPAQIVDTCETTAFPTSCGGSGFSIAADGVTIRNFTIRHASLSGVAAINNDIHVDNVCIFDTANVAVSVTGDDFKLTDSLIQGNTQNAAVSIVGNEMLIRGNTLLHTDGMNLVGNEAKVIHNFVRLTEDNQCIDVTGERARISWNELEGCGEDGVVLVGNDAKILHNLITLAPDDEDAIDALGNDLEIAYNVLRNVWEAGIEYTGNSSKIHHNEISGGGDQDDAGLDIEGGDDNLIAHNQVTGSSRSGIRNEGGNRNKYVHNLTAGNGQSGIRIATGDSNVVAHNESYDNHGEGINNGKTATNTKIEDNRSFGNRTDICNDGTLAEFDDNHFKSGGPDRACVVEQLL